MTSYAKFRDRLLDHLELIEDDGPTRVVRKECSAKNKSGKKKCVVEMDPWLECVPEKKWNNFYVPMYRRLNKKHPDFHRSVKCTDEIDVDFEEWDEYSDADMVTEIVETNRLAGSKYSLIQMTVDYWRNKKNKSRLKKIKRKQYKEVATMLKYMKRESDRIMSSFEGMDEYMLARVEGGDLGRGHMNALLSLVTVLLNYMDDMISLLVVLELEPTDGEFRLTRETKSRLGSVWGSIVGVSSRAISWARDTLGEVGRDLVGKQALISLTISVLASSLLSETWAPVFFVALSKVSWTTLQTILKQMGLPAWFRVIFGVALFTLNPFVGGVARLQTVFQKHPDVCLASAENMAKFRGVVSDLQGISHPNQIPALLKGVPAVQCFWEGPDYMPPPSGLVADKLTVFKAALADLSNKVLSGMQTVGRATGDAYTAAAEKGPEAYAYAARGYDAAIPSLGKGAEKAYNFAAETVVPGVVQGGEALAAGFGMVSRGYVRGMIATFEFLSEKAQRVQDSGILEKSFDYASSFFSS